MTLVYSGGLGGGAGDLGIRFNNIPIVEDDANDNSLVWEFTGGAGENEIGAGGGLPEVDRTLTQYGNIPAAENGGRSLADSGDYFVCTPAAMNRFNVAASGLTIIYQCSHLAAQGQLGYPSLNNKLSWHGWPLTSQSFSSGEVTQTTIKVGVGAPAAYPVNSIFWHILTLNYTDGIGFAGIAIKDTLPDAVTDFIGTSVFFNASHNFVSSSSWATYSSIVGGNYSGSALYKIRSLTLSENPYISLR